MPRANKKDGKISINVMLPPRLKERMDLMALKTKRTRSAYVELALEEQLKKDGAK